MHHSPFNHIQTRFSGKIAGKVKSFCVLTGLLFLILSCSNNHCDDSMYAPLIVSFYSEIDTSLQVFPKFMVIEGVDTYNFINASGSNGVQLMLRKFEGSSSFSFAFANDQSKIDTLVFVEKRSNSDCPCSNPKGDSVSVYRENNNILFLCDQANSTMIVYKERPEPLFLRNTNQDTLFAFEPVKDILSVKHTNTQEFISAECGCLTTFYLDELQHTNNNIRDALIVKKSVTGNYNEKQHVRIYFENY